MAATLVTLGGAATALVALSGLGRDIRGLPAAIGAGRSQILPAAARSPHFTDAGFHNTEPSHVIVGKDMLGLIPEFVTRGDRGHPKGAIPLVTAVPAVQAGELGVTWLGHATTLIEIDGRHVLADPVWSRPGLAVRLVGPARMHPVPVPPVELPILTPLSSRTITTTTSTCRPFASSATQPAPSSFRWASGPPSWLGVPEERIVELGWD